jgi:hypothetical protein
MSVTSPTRTVVVSACATGGWIRSGFGISTTVTVPVAVARPFDSV